MTIVTCQTDQMCDKRDWLQEPHRWSTVIGVLKNLGMTVVPLVSARKAASIHNNHHDNERTGFFIDSGKKG